MKQLFVVVSRNIEEEVKTVVCEDFIEACATQAACYSPLSICRDRP